MTPAVHQDLPASSFTLYILYLALTKKTLLAHLENTTFYHSHNSGNNILIFVLFFETEIGLPGAQMCPTESLKIFFMVVVMMVFGVTVLHETFA